MSGRPKIEKSTRSGGRVAWGHNRQAEERRLRVQRLRDAEEDRRSVRREAFLDLLGKVCLPGEREAVEAALAREGLPGARRKLLEILDGDAGWRGSTDAFFLPFTAKDHALG